MAELTSYHCVHGLTCYTDPDGRWVGGCEFESGDPYSDPCDHLPDSVRSDLRYTLQAAPTKTQPDREVERAVGVRRVRFGIETESAEMPTSGEFSESLSTTPVSEHVSCCGPTADWLKARAKTAKERAYDASVRLDAARKVTATPPLRARRTEAEQIRLDRLTLARWIMQHPGASTEADEERMRSLKSHVPDDLSYIKHEVHKCRYPCDGRCGQYHAAPGRGDRHYGNIERADQGNVLRREVANEDDEDDDTIRQIVGRARTHPVVGLRKRDEEDDAA